MTSPSLFPCLWDQFLLLLFALPLCILASTLSPQEAEGYETFSGRSPDGRTPCLGLAHQAGAVFAYSWPFFRWPGEELSVTSCFLRPAAPQLPGFQLSRGLEGVPTPYSRWVPAL